MHFAFIGILFLLGIVTGLAVALPYGPVGFVIIRRFYLFGMKSGMISALGNALSDGFYAMVVGFGLHRIEHFLLAISRYTEIGAGLVLIYLGARAVTTKLSLDEDEVENHPIQDVTSTFLINILNPTLIFAFALVFTILAKITHTDHFGFYGTLSFLMGIPVGTCLLWFLTGSLIHYLRRNNKHSVVEKINYGTGAILGILGVGVLIEVLVRFIRWGIIVLWIK